jgi:hypothetical protein
MQEKRKETEAELEKRKSEATSKETLEDLEESKKVTGSLNRDDYSIPSPDGADETRHDNAASGDPM